MMTRKQMQNFGLLLLEMLKKYPAWLSKDNWGVFDKMLKQSDGIYRFATKCGLLEGLLLCAEGFMIAMSIFVAIGSLLQVMHPWN